MAARPPAKKQQQQQPPPPPPQEPPPPALGPVAKTLIAVGATRAALGPAAAGTYVAAKAVSLPAEAIAEIVEATTKGLARYLTFRRAAVPEEIASAVQLAYPERTPAEVDQLSELEVAYENAFLSKMQQRLARDLPKALSLVDPDARRRAVQAILDRERRYIEARQQATFERSLARAEALAAKKVSPQGAYWWLSPLVLKHTPDCIALGEQFWPWSVIEKVGGPPRHPGCRCQLLTLEEATQRGLMTADQANVDEHDRLKAAHAALDKAAKVIEAVDDDEWKLWVTILTEGNPLEQLEEAGWATRWPAGTLRGGQFKPQRGGDPGALARRAARRGLRKAAADLLALHFPHYPLPPRVMRHAGAETVIGGHNVFVPHGRSFSRRIGGHHYTSPPGSTAIHRDGKPFLDPRFEGPSALHAKGNMAILTPVEPNVGGRDEVDLPLEIPSGVAGRARDLQRTRGEAFDRQITQSLRARDPAQPPVRIGQDGHDAHTALSRAGFVETDIPTVSENIRIPYVAPDGASTLEVSYGADGQVELAHWRPNDPAPRGSELTRPPATFDEFATDLRAFGDRVARDELGSGHRAWLNEVRQGTGKPDHAAEQLWNGDVELGDDFTPDLAAAAEARAQGQQLTQAQLRGLWAATQSSHHEALHGVNPIGPQDYDDPTERALEEALVEELSHVEAANSLRLQGQHDAAQWALDHPADAKVAGTYLAERVALSHIADRLGVPPEQRENFLRDLKFRVLPGTRAEWLAGQLAGGQPTDAQTLELRDLIANPPSAAHVAPILAIPGQPNPTLGYPSPAGPVWEGDHVDLASGDTGTIARIQDPEPGEPWTAAVQLDSGGYLYAVPGEIRDVQPGSRGAAQLGGDTIHEGDHVAWTGGEAQINRILAQGTSGWAALDATTTGGDTPGARVILTPENAPQLRRTSRPDAPAASRPATGGTQEPLPEPPSGVEPSNRVPDPRAPTGQMRAPERDYSVRPRANLAAATAFADTHGATLHTAVPADPRALDSLVDHGFHVERGEMVRTGSEDPRLRPSVTRAAPSPGSGEATPLSSMSQSGGRTSPVRGRRNAMALADYLGTRIAAHRSYGTPEWDGGYYDGLEHARRMIARGGSQADILALAHRHGPLKGGDDRNQGYQDAMRHAYFEIEGDRREDNLALFHRPAADRPPAVMTGKATPPITSGLDYYKATMSQVQQREHPAAQVTFTLKNRGSQRLADFVRPAELQRRLDAFQAGWSADEIAALASLEKVGGGPVFGHDFLAYLSGRPLPPVKVSLDPKTDDLHVETTGDWPMVTFWETVVMSELNDAYFQNYVRRTGLKMADVRAEGDRRLDQKIALLKAHPDIKVAEFGTRRRFGRDWQKHVVERLKAEVPGNLIGSSNIAIAHELGVPPIGSYAHEMDMVYAGLAAREQGDVPASHSQMLTDWRAAYGNDLSIALTDTFTTKFFFDHLTTAEAEHWQGLRHDSGDPFVFGEDAIAWYEDHGIDPRTKTLLFSDALDMDKAVALNDRFKGRVKVAFGIGTNLSNDVGLKPLNIVMKATAVDGEPTVKLSDNPGKHTGSSAKVAEYQKLFGAVPQTPVGELVGGKQNQPVELAVLAGKAPTGKANEPAGAIWDDAHTISITKAAGGTTGAMFATSPTGEKWLVKRYGGKVDRVAAEWLANRVYAAMGLKVAEAQTLDFGGKPALAYPLVDGVPGHNGLQPKNHKQLGRGFMVDALTANWDVVGLEHDNLLWPSGTTAGNLADADPYRVDQGGVFEYRAQGAPKPYGPVPTEVWSMNGPGGQAFGRMALPDGVKRDGAAAIANRLTDARVDELVDAAPFEDDGMRERIRENLKARIGWMRQYAAGKVNEPPTGKANLPVEPKVNVNTVEPGALVRDKGGQVWKIAGRSKGLWLLEQPKNPNVTKQADDSFMKQYTMVNEPPPVQKAAAPWTPGGSYQRVPSKPEPKPLEGADARIALRSAQEKVDLMPEEAAALNAYGQGWADAVNDSLRHGKPEEASKELKYLVKELDSITRFIRTKDAVTLYAALPPGELKANQKVQEKGYLTLTTRLDEAQRAAGEKGNVLRLLVPSGANAAYLPAWEVSDEIAAPPDAEVLLPRGSQLVVSRQEGRMIDAALVAPKQYSYSPAPVKRLVDAPDTTSFDPGKPVAGAGKKLGGPPLRQTKSSGYKADVEVGDPPGPTFAQAQAEWDQKKRYAPTKKATGTEPEKQGKLHGWLPAWLGGGDEPESDMPTPEKKTTGGYPGHSAGVIVTEPDGRIWFFEPKNHFGGYQAALSKGHVDEGETPQQGALRELWEETGLTAEITGEVGTYAGDTTLTTYFTGKRTGGAPWGGNQDETWAVKLGKPEDAAQVLRARDILALQDAGLLARAEPPEAPAHGAKGKANPPVAPEWRYLWPPHGVAGTPGGKIEPSLEQAADVVISKGMDRDREAYSAFDGQTPEGGKLADWLRARGVRRVAVGGLATDYCVKSTALDAAKSGFETWFLPRASRGITPETSAAAEAEMRAAGVQFGAPPTGDATETALIVVDVQGAFLPGGSLAVPAGDKVIPVLEREVASGRYGSVAASRDWHPPDHKSFVTEKVSRPGGKPNEAAATGDWAKGPAAGDVMWTGWKKLVPGDRVVSYRNGKVLASGQVARVNLPRKGGSAGAVFVRVNWDNGATGRVADPARNLRREEGPLEPPTKPNPDLSTTFSTTPLSEAEWLVELVLELEEMGDWAAALHPRDRAGKFAAKLAQLKQALGRHLKTKPAELKGRGGHVIRTGRANPGTVAAVGVALPSIADAVADALTSPSPGFGRGKAHDIASAVLFVADHAADDLGRYLESLPAEVFNGLIWVAHHPEIVTKALALVHGDAEPTPGDALEESIWQEILHPRGRGGEWARKISPPGTVAYHVAPVHALEQIRAEGITPGMRGHQQGGKTFAFTDRREAERFARANEHPTRILPVDVGGLETGKDMTIIAGTGAIAKADTERSSAIWVNGPIGPERIKDRERELLDQLHAADKPQTGKANLPAGASPVEVAQAKGVDLKAAFAPADASPAHPQRMEYRMRGAAAILEAHAEQKDAVLKLPDDKEPREKLLEAITSGDKARALKEYRETPLADLEALSKITVETKPVYGRANANLQSRAVQMGSTSAIGDFRHELGHTLRAAMGGAGGPHAHTPMTDYISQRHNEALGRLKANIQAKKPKPKTHVDWEEQTGLGGSRGKDSWEEDFAEQYRGYHKAVFQTRHPEDKEHDAQALEKYRSRHPEWARFWDSWYTAQLAGRTA